MMKFFRSKRLVMSKCNISCDVIDSNNKTRGWEVTPEGRVWPCCFFANAYDKRLLTHEYDTKNTADSNRLNDESATLFDDPTMVKLLKDDPTWNHLEHHSLEEIISHEVFQTHIYYEGWESDNPPLCCVANCRIDK